jgi:ketosteroid isomerase-like protein
MSAVEDEIWATVHRHLRSIFERDAAAYAATTAEELSLYEWFVTPHRQDGLPFHLFMIAHGWANTEGDYRYDLWEPRLQVYGDAAIVSYTFMLTTVQDGRIEHRTHNESRVLVRGAAGWQVVHVHKSPT